MRRHRRPSFAFIVYSMFSMLDLAGAAEQVQKPPSRDVPTWALGLGVISAPRPYVGADDDVQVIPLVDIRYRRFYLQGIRTGYRLVDAERVRMDLRARARFAGFEEDDSPFLAGMEQRRFTIDAGLGADWTVGPVELGLGVFRDVLDRSGGIEAETKLTWPKILRNGRVGLFPAVGVVWQDDDFVDYYAGVRPDEATPDRPAYAGEQEINVEAGLTVFCRFRAHWRAVLIVSGRRLGGAYESSPIVDRQWGVFGLVGLAYEF